VFFGYKACAGSLASSTSLSLEVQPVDIDGNRKGLVKISLDHGENWSVIIEKVEVWVVADDFPRQITNVRFKAPDRKCFRLSPKEKTQYGAIVDLPSTGPALVEARIIMRQQFFLKKFGRGHQFGSVAVPPPVPKPDGSNKKELIITCAG
jgi:hypothetical protein